MGWRDWETDNDWIAETLEVQPAFWTMTYLSSSDHALQTGGIFDLTPEFNEWCQNNLAGYWEIGSGTIRVACNDDAVLLRLYMGGG